MILFVGAFPPPIHGMSMVSQEVYNRLIVDGWSVKKLDTAPKDLKRDLLSRLSRVGRVLEAWFNLIRSQKNQDVLYIALSGEWGQIYDIVSLAIARIKNMHCVLHHHNFSYLKKRSSLTSVLFRVAGREAVHVVLCNIMGRVLQSQYGSDTKILVLSNLAFFPPEVKVRLHPKLRTIGFLSNLTKEKGTEIIIALAFEIKKRGVPLNVIVAGSCQDKALIKKLQQAEAAEVLEWRGSVYGEEKTMFFQNIDTFVFPTQNEAEPLVIWEVLAAGVPAITYQRGCIEEQLGDAGVLVSPDEDFISKALVLLEGWLRDESDYQHFVQQAQVQYLSMLEKTVGQWQELHNCLSKNDLTRLEGIK